MRTGLEVLKVLGALEERGAYRSSVKGLPSSSSRLRVRVLEQAGSLIITPFYDVGVSLIEMERVSGSKRRTQTYS